MPPTREEARPLASVKHTGQVEKAELAETQKILPVPQDETARTKTNEPSINGFDGPVAVPAQETPSTQPIDSTAKEREETESMATPTQEKFSTGLVESKTEETGETGSITPAQTAGGADNDTEQIKLPNGIDLIVPSASVETRLLEFLSRTSHKSDTFDLDRVTFDATHATLTPSSSEQLQNVAKILRAYPNTKISINAYVDKKASGLRLPWERSNSVLRELAKMGVERSHMTTELYSSNRAKRSSTPEKGQNQNQYISLTVSKL